MESLHHGQQIVETISLITIRQQQSSFGSGSGSMPRLKKGQDHQLSKAYRQRRIITKLIHVVFQFAFKVRNIRYYILRE
ncbi:MAG TPA: hypothetical protein DEW39_01435 [Brevibacterium sp.]|nr:hypothetical protein [Brevibacterium sp.]